MKTHDTLEALCKGHRAFFTWEKQPGTKRSKASGRYPSTGPARKTSQAERAVVHPDRDDLEWLYCRSGWVG